ncbi:MAG: hypothetical protein WCG05_00610 [Alphaproteobacteria bacterium]
MNFMKFLLLAISIPMLGLSSPSSEKFDSPKWTPYRLAEPEKSQVSFATDRLTAEPITSANFTAVFESGKTLFSNPDVLANWAGPRTASEKI